MYLFLRPNESPLFSFWTFLLDGVCACMCVRERVTPKESRIVSQSNGKSMLYAVFQRGAVRIPENSPVASNFYHFTVTFQKWLTKSISFKPRSKLIHQEKHSKPWCLLFVISLCVSCPPEQINKGCSLIRVRNLSTQNVWKIPCSVSSNIHASAIRDVQ